MQLPEWLHRTLHLPYLLTLKKTGKGKQTIVFLHGLAAHRQIWDETVKNLGHHYRCVAIDLLGHGKSPKPTHLNYTVQEHLRCVRWTLFWHGIWDAKIVVGHSMGSITAIHWAYRYPNEVSRIVLTALPMYQRIADIAQRKRFEGMIDSVYLGFYRALRGAPQALTIRSAQAIVKRAPALLGNLQVDEATWYPIVSSLKCTVEEQTTLDEITSLRSDMPIDLIYGSMDQLVRRSNLKRAFGDRPRTRFTKLLTSHEITPRYTRAIIRAISHEPAAD